MDEFHPCLSLSPLHPRADGEAMAAGFNRKSLSGVIRFTILLIALGTGFAAEPHTPKQGSPERKAILDALRVPVEAELKQRVIFKVDRMEVLDGWAFLGGVPLTPDGGEIDYRGTIHEEAIREGAFDGGIFALLRERNGVWKTVRFKIGATDIPYIDWPTEFKAPEVIFEN